MGITVGCKCLKVFPNYTESVVDCLILLFNP